jgi:hypothetical protein
MTALIERSSNLMTEISCGTAKMPPILFMSTKSIGS